MISYPSGSRRGRRAPWAWACAAVLLGAGCTDVQLIRNVDVVTPAYDNKIEVSGEICTSDPADVVFPLKVLFIIDASQSMNINDPVDPAEQDPTLQTGRSTAIRQVIEQFIDLGIQFAPDYCSTGVNGCEKGSTSCPDCPANAICVGPDCCRAPPCNGAPACPTAGLTNGTCLPLCDTTVAGCGPGESNCPGCPNAGDRCLNGICGKTLDPGVEFAIMRFGASKNVLTRDPDGTEGFTSDPGELVAAVPQVGIGASVTDYEGALSTAFKVLSSDMIKMKKTNAAAVNRSKYVVIFLSDGQPDPRINVQDDWDGIPSDLQSELLGGSGLDPNAIATYNVPARVLRRVKEIISLKAIHRIGEITLHTAYLAGQNPAWAQDQAIALLKQMAQVGNGTFRNFQNGEEINFLHVGFSSLRRVFRLKNFIASNLNGRPKGGTTVVDSDGDSLDDNQERLAGTNAALLDSDADGFSDTLEHFFRTSGWDALDPADADCSLAGNDADGDGRVDDTDGDGLLDCEERFLGTAKDLFDTDADGVPDSLEVRFGTNPVAKDINNDLDFDGMPNGDELRLHTDPRADDAAHRSRASYRYDVKRIGTGIETVGIDCKLDADCPQSNSCGDAKCRCGTDDDCSSLATCATDLECTLPGETCDGANCRSKYTCQTVDAFAGTGNSCAQQKNITCYRYNVKNIALVTPKPSPTETEEGWNNVYLYFGEVPFDNPDDYGQFKVACVRARFLATGRNAGAKLPANGQVSVPQSAWKDPALLDPKTDCVCPDSQVGACPAAP